MDQAETLTLPIVKRISDQVLVKLLQYSSFMIVFDHLPAVAALNIAEHLLERISGRGPVGFRPEVVVGSAVQLN
jgi:hypothetical protein